MKEVHVRLTLFRLKGGKMRHWDASGGGLARPLSLSWARGKGHREADPPALADLLPDGAGQAGLGPGDQARGRGLQRHERRRLRAPLLRRSRRAGEPRHPARGREAGRGLLRGRALLAAAGELLPRSDQVRPTTSWRRCARRSRCSPTAASPTRSRCGSPCSRSPGATRTRSARATGRRSRWR